MTDWHLIEGTEALRRLNASEAGLKTEIGGIAELLSGGAGVKTPLQVRMTRFGRYLGLAVLAICVVVFIAGRLQGQPVMLMFLTAVSLAVAAIPEALPAVVTISLAFGARKLIRHNALVRNLPAVETLGSVTYICADKTGTLTQNRMTAERFFAEGQSRDSLPGPEVGPPWSELGCAMVLNNDVSQMDGHQAGEPTELAIFEAGDRAGYDKASLEQGLPRVSVIPFDSRRKQMTTLHRTDGGHVAYVKGAPERVLRQCTAALSVDGDAPFDPDEALARADQLAGEGYRVLAVARRTLDGGYEAETDAEAIERDLTFLGLVALIDPPREEVPLAVRSEHVSIFKLGLTSNLPMLGAVLLTILLQLMVIYVPALNAIFHTQPLPLQDLAICFALSSLVLFAVEIEKWLVRRKLIYQNG